MRPRAIMTCVEYGDILALTLPYTLKHVLDLLVVTTDTDDETRSVCQNHGVQTFSTDAFYRHGARFNKGLALEEGFDVMRRWGWILVLDADIVLPDHLEFNNLNRNFLYGCRRAIWPNPWTWNGADWGHVEPEPESDILGYFQLFHARAVKSKPWYPTNYTSAATVDQVFGWNHFSNMGRYLPYTVLHLGSLGINWCGRTQPRADGSVPEKVGERRCCLNHMIQRRLASDANAEKITGA